MKNLLLFCLFALSLYSVQGQTTKKKSSNKKSVSVKYSEEKALEFVNDNYYFYDANTVYRNPKLRRVSNNVFIVSVEECMKSFQDDGDFFWRSVVYTLTIKSNTKYTYNRRF